MSLVVLIPLSIGLGLIGLASFFWALRNGQFDDPEGDAWRILSPESTLPKEGNPDDKLATDTAHRHARGRL
ncbi:MAG: cbb3-type cytochrome oxidase assembly protein CcoS [Rhodobacteraceae bacterium]|nr:cbb3-type cytochrome oxidase assembly protein CcoS [Paracoccaceae bacterium]